MLPADGALAGLMAGYGIFGVVAVFLCYHKRHTIHFRANVFFIALATLALVRCLFFGLSIYYEASRSSRDFLDDIPGILFFSTCCLFLYRVKPTTKVEDSWRKYIRLMSNFYVLTTVNILFYLFYFILLYLTFTYQDQRDDDQDDSTNDKVLAVETCISSLFAAGYFFQATAFLLLGLPYFCRIGLTSDQNQDCYVDIEDPNGGIDKNENTSRTATSNSGKSRERNSTSLNNSEADIGIAAARAYNIASPTAFGLPKCLSDEASFIDVRFSSDVEDGSGTHTIVCRDHPSKWRDGGDSTDDEFEGGNGGPAAVDIEVDRIIKPKELKVTNTDESTSVLTISCRRRSLLVAGVWLIICCFSARVTFLILSTFFETPDQYNLHGAGNDGREAAKVLTRFMYYFIGEVLPSYLLLLLHLHVIAQYSPIPSKNATSEATESALLLSSNSIREFTNIAKGSGVPCIEENELLMGELIGCGSFGVVNKAQWRGLDVAVKRLYLPTHMQQDETIESFTQEILLVSKLRHPNVVQFLGYTPQPLMLITEFMPLGSLTEVLRNPVIKDQLDHQRRLRMARDIALGMSYLHGSSILHRDLCPSNCLVDANMVVKIADFGLARLKSLSRTMTRGLGTPAYMAPEALKNLPYTEKADVYSFAVCFWQLLTNEEPYEAMKGAYQVLYAVTNGIRPPLDHDALGDNERELLERCWADDPQQRPPFKAVLQRLNRMLALELEDDDDDYWERSYSDDDEGDDGTNRNGHDRQTHHHIDSS